MAFLVAFHFSGSMTSFADILERSRDVKIHIITGPVKKVEAARKERDILKWNCVMCDDDEGR